MTTKLLYLFTRTPLHIGTGASVGAIDQPIQRERHTGFPIIPGSSIKGVLADQYNEIKNGRVVIDEKRKATARTEEGARLFGLGSATEDNGKAGSISFSEARLLAFPVRSAKGCFAWLTSPMILQRWARDTGSTISLPKLKDNKAYFNAKTHGETIQGHSQPAILLEDYLYHYDGEFELAKILTEETTADPLWKALASEHLVLVSDSTLKHFAETTCEIAQHVVIDDETGTAKDGLLFNQENVPAETLFYSQLISQKMEDLEILTVPNPIQLGGNATTGLGFCTTNQTNHQSPE